MRACNIVFPFLSTNEWQALSYNQMTKHCKIAAWPHHHALRWSLTFPPNHFQPHRASRQAPGLRIPLRIPPALQQDLGEVPHLPRQPPPTPHTPTLNPVQLPKPPVPNPMCAPLSPRNIPPEVLVAVNTQDPPVLPGSTIGSRVPVLAAGGYPQLTQRSKGR